MNRWYLLFLLFCTLLGVGGAYFKYQPLLDEAKAAAALKPKATPTPTSAPKMRTFEFEVICIDGIQYNYVQPNMVLLKHNPEYIIGLNADRLLCPD